MYIEMPWLVYFPTSECESAGYHKLLPEITQFYIYSEDPLYGSDSMAYIEILSWWCDSRYQGRIRTGFGKCWTVMQIENAFFQNLESCGKRDDF